MFHGHSTESGFSTKRLLLALAFLAGSASLTFFSFAATPSSGTLSEATPVLEYSSGPFLQSNPVPVPVAQSNPTCNNNANPCDSYVLTVNLSAAYIAANPNALAKVALTWTDTGSGNSDYDLYIYQGEVATTTASTAPLARSTSSGPTPETASIYPLSAGTNKFTIKIVPYTATAETTRVKIELLAGSGGPSGFPGFGQADPTVPNNPRYQTFYPPKGTSAEAGDGEFNIGFNPNTGRFMLNNIGPVWRVTPPEHLLAGSQPECCEALWENRNSIVADTGVDPILWTDGVSGRTFASHFTGGPNAAYAYTDNDGDPSPTQPTGWTVLGAALPTGGADHQTIASGPYPASLSNLTTPLNQGQAVYYCTQAIAGPAACQRSDDLGASYGPGTLAYTGDRCAGLHGHARVGPDGVVYLPVPDCGSTDPDNLPAEAGLAVSSDGGVSWTEFFLPDSLPQAAGSDSAIAIDSNNKIYYAYIKNNSNSTEGRLFVRVGTPVKDGTGEVVDITWGADFDVGASHGVVNSAFPHVVAGDDGRAAVGFLGTDRPGDFQSIGFPGYWYAFMAHTYNGGQNWVTTNVSPNDPVQGKGGIWQQGGSATNRNLLDFNEITMDDEGRVAFGYSDGCVGECVGNPDNNSFVAHMRMARQIGGKTLLAAFDPGEPIAPNAPCLSGNRDASASHLTWKVPDNGGADIAYYRIFRGTSSGALTHLADTGTLLAPNNKASYDDTTADAADEHLFYKVQAVNSQGTSVDSNEIDLVVAPLPPVQTPCTLPGMTVLTDTAGDSLVGQQGLPQHDIHSISVAEPYYPDGSQKLVFTIKVANLNVLPANTTYPLYFTGANGSGFYVGFRTAAPATVATPRFEYGTAVLTEPTYTTTYVGNADPESSYSADGTIRIVVPRSVFAGGAGAPIGGTLTKFFLRVRIEPGLTPDNCPNGLVAAGSYLIVGNGFCAPQVTLREAVSRKTHGTAGTFDLNLPLDGSGIEMRRGTGTNNGTHDFILRFVNALTSVGGVSVNGGSVSSTGQINPSDATEYLVTVTGAPNAAYLDIVLNNVTDSTGTTSAERTLRLGLLRGDVNSSGRTDNGDVAAVRAKSVSVTAADNFRLDVAPSGRVDNGDVAATRAVSVSVLP